MDLFVFLAVLVAAAFHAGWNALLKLKVEPIVATCLMALASSAVVLPLLPFVGLPAPPSWPYLLGSVVVHIAYFLALAQAYRFGDLGQVYPIARGSAPLLTALLAGIWIGEPLGAYGWAGIIVLASGILLLALRGRRALQAFDARSVGFALLTSLTITAYTLIDGLGARISHSPLQYTVWLFLLSGAAMGALRHRGNRPALHHRVRRELEDSGGRRHSVDGGLCHRHLGDDGGADRAGGGAARDERAVCDTVRRGAVARAAAARAHRRRLPGARGRRAGAAALSGNAAQANQAFLLAALSRSMARNCARGIGLANR